MAFKDWFKNALTPAPIELSIDKVRPVTIEPEPEVIEAPVKETKLVEAAGTTIEDESGWRRLTGDSSRDISPISQERMQDLALHSWRTNPLGNRLIELTVAFLLAEGVRLTAPDPDAQDVLDRFWNDPINSMDVKLAKKVRELALYGEQCWPVFVNEYDRQVRLGYVDPSNIATVVTDPDNIEQPIGIVTKRDRKGRTKRFRVIINGPETVFTRRTQAIRETFDSGDCFFFTINGLSNSSRGTSDLLHEIDWLDAYEQALYGELERWDFMRSFIWDVTLKGATEEEVIARAKQLKPPRPGSNRVHNDNEEWNAVTPDLNAEDTTAIARLIRNHILSGMSFPEHWFGGGGDVNRATASEMGEPIIKALSMRQRTWKHILEGVAIYVLRQWKSRESSDLDIMAEEKYRPTAEFPDLRTRDVTSYAAALQQVIAGTAIAADRGLLSEQTAVKLIGMVASGLGLEIDAETELEAAHAELAERQEKDSFPGLDPEDLDDDSDPVRRDQDKDDEAADA